MKLCYDVYKHHNKAKSIEKIRFYPRFALAIRVIRVPFDLSSYFSFYKVLIKKTQHPFENAINSKTQGKSNNSNIITAYTIIYFGFLVLNQIIVPARAPIVKRSKM